MIRFVIYDGAGLDALWFTQDDVVNIYDAYYYDANGNGT
jgi:hypothetical protein